MDATGTGTCYVYRGYTLTEIRRQAGRATLYLWAVAPCRPGAAPIAYVSTFDDARALVHRSISR